MSTNAPDPTHAIAPAGGGIGVLPPGGSQAPPPAPDNPGAAALDRFASLTKLLYEAFEIAIPEVRAWFENRNEPVNPWLFSTWTRYLVKTFLTKHGQTAEEEEIRLGNVANIGLWLRVGDEQVRIWKAVHGGIPTPGSSEIRVAYYCQEPLPGFDRDSVADPTPHNYIIAWDVDEKYSFNGLLLALPRSATATSIELMWPVVSVPHPAVTILPDSSAVVRSAEDLPIGIDRDKADAKQANAKRME